MERGEQRSEGEMEQQNVNRLKKVEMFCGNVDCTTVMQHLRGIREQEMSSRNKIRKEKQRKEISGLNKRYSEAVP